MPAITLALSFCTQGGCEGGYNLPSKRALGLGGTGVSLGHDGTGGGEGANKDLVGGADGRTGGDVTEHLGSVVEGE